MVRLHLPDHAVRRCCPRLDAKGTSRAAFPMPAPGGLDWTRIMEGVMSLWHFFLRRQPSPFAVEGVANSLAERIPSPSRTLVWSHQPVVSVRPGQSPSTAAKREKKSNLRRRRSRPDDHVPGLGNEAHRSARPQPKKKKKGTPSREPHSSQHEKKRAAKTFRVPVRHETVG